jgi:hypothetical protein
LAHISTARFESPFVILTTCSSKVLAALADNAKHNKDGRVDEHGALRHRKVELCPVGAIAMMFFSYFHILCLSAPRFEPDFTNPSYGEYGHRSWYECYVFPGERVDKQMSYDSMCSSSAAPSDHLRLDDAFQTTVIG